MSKYIDLHDEIADSIHWDATVADTLKWLDEHREQLPGRTVRQSRLDKMATDTSDRYMRGVKAGLILAGAEIVPDPEPSNEELLEHEIRELFQTPSTSFSIARDLAQKLDAAGWTKGETNDA